MDLRREGVVVPVAMVVRISEGIKEMQRHFTVISE